MNRIFLVVTSISFFACEPNGPVPSNTETNETNQEVFMISQSELTNEKIKAYDFLDCMYSDSYFPGFLVDKCKHILLDLCYKIENEKPETLDDLYQLTHRATEKINDLEDEFYENGSEIETGARECFGENFDFISKAYGFEADVEELIAPRNW